MRSEATGAGMGGNDEQPTQEAETAMNDTQATIQWRVSVPVLRNTVILKQLGLAIGIPFGLVALVMALTSGESVYTLYGLGMIGALLILTWLFIMAFYRGKYEAEFVLDDKGVLCRTQAKQAKKNRIVNALTVVLGLLSGKATVAGIGMLAQSRQGAVLKWSHVRKVKYKPRQQTILLKGGFSERVALFCTSEIYAQVEQKVLLQTKKCR
ncbi:MAG: hypothetical protein PHO66_00120 [Eubacteriales bacterium]|nr:hypothetical protein [Eubacteriales bacterium]